MVQQLGLSQMSSEKHSSIKERWRRANAVAGIVVVGLLVGLGSVGGISGGEKSFAWGVNIDLGLLVGIVVGGYPLRSWRRKRRKSLPPKKGNS